MNSIKIFKWCGLLASSNVTISPKLSLNKLINVRKLSCSSQIVLSKASELRSKFKIDSSTINPVNNVLRKHDYSSSNVSLSKKRIKKRYALEIDPENMEPGTFTVVAYATAKEYDLEKLKMALMTDRLYMPLRFTDQEMPNTLLALAKYKITDEPRHIFFFREGSVVFWNCTDLEASNVLSFLNMFGDEPYREDVIWKEREVMIYKYQPQGKNCQLQGSTFLLSPDPENLLEKYTFSNAMSQTVKLGIWENILDHYGQSLTDVSEDLEKGKPIMMTRSEVLRKTGALFALRHHINLDSDLLDTPDFYWERAALEKLYGDTIAYFSLSRRTKVLNEKLSHCAELVELVAEQLSDRHHVRLEWMIIILIMVEVGFEILHFSERYWQHIFEK